MPVISPRRLPRALSCSDPAVYRIPVPPFSLTGSVALSHSSHTGISARCRSFAPSWAVCTNPPFSPTAAPAPVTINLSPTRTDTKKRHWQQPLVTEMCERVFREYLKWRPDCGYTGRTVLVTRLAQDSYHRLESLRNF